jgi:hypothetical protein
VLNKDDVQEAEEREVKEEIEEMEELEELEGFEEEETENPPPLPAKDYFKETSDTMEEVRLMFFFARYILELVFLYFKKHCLQRRLSSVLLLESNN